MKTYLYISKLRMQTMLAYRMEVLTYTIMQALIMLSVGFFWKAAYGGTEAAHGVTGNSMITYTVISALMGSMYHMGVEDRISDAVKTGSIATDLIKPVNLFGMYLAEDMGNLAICFFCSTLPIFIVAAAIFGLPAPASLQHFLMFLPSFALSYGINWTFSALFAMIAFTAIDLGPAFSVKYHFVIVEFYSEHNIPHSKAEIIKCEGEQTVYRFRKDEITAAELMTDISKQVKIKDIRIEEANIDDIIRIAYNNK
ncbi:MAG: ABC-2 family transporter protein [Huintestinicola sp.]